MVFFALFQIICFFLKKKTKKQKKKKKKKRLYKPENKGHIQSFLTQPFSWLDMICSLSWY